MSKRANMEDVYPLSPTQEGMLFHTLSDPRSGMYVGQFGFRVAADLDADAFARAWQGVVDRHPALRTGFAWERVATPLQVVVRAAALPFRSEDWRGDAPETRAAKLEAFLRADREEGFDLRRAPLMRLALFRLGDAEYQVVWTHHHMILDGWSLGRVYRDVLALYPAYVEGREARLPRPRPYRDYIAWLRERAPEPAEHFWREALAGFSTPTPLGIGRPSEAASAGASEAGRRALLLPREATAAVQALARRGRITTGTVVQGAWALLLSRYSGEEDVVFGTAVSGRPAGLEGVEEMVGLFVATLPLRARVLSDATVLEWLECLHRWQAEMREHEHAPLVRIQGWSEVPRGLRLFDSVVALQNHPVASSTSPEGLRVEEVWGLQTNDAPLALTVSPVGEETRLECTYHSGRFRADEVERALEHLGAVLEALAAGPGERLGGVSLLRSAERAELLAAGSPAPAEFPVHPPLHRLFLEQAARRPGAVALTCGDERVSYAELDRRSARLAGALRRRGVDPETRVALCAERSVDLVVGILGILRAGGAYVPVDPGYPAERIAYLLEDSGCAAVLAQESVRTRLAPARAEVLALEEVLAEGAEGDTAPEVEADPGNAAYVIYTSGSTGRPKGVVVTHASVVRLFDATRAWFGFD
ncbi:MAG: AMP-binding protein, partial [Gemmatimonadetes bacterium]|nr:AMP-binding protein [Gemmatimonadota bacterium]